VDARNVLTTSFNLPEATYPGLAARRQFYDQLLSRVSASPTVESAAISSEIPMRGGNNGYIKVDGVTDPALTNQLVGWNFITPDYFRTLRIPLLKGRGLSAADVDRAAATSQRFTDLIKAAQGKKLEIPKDMSLVAVISQTTERTFWKDQDAVGRSYDWNGMKVTVIGVVGDVKENGIRARMMPQAYLPLPLSLSFGGSAYLTVKTRIAPAVAIPALRKQVKELDATLAPDRPQSLSQVIAEDMQDVSLQAFLLGTFALLALVLAAIGLYGVMSYLVNQRTREIGIRMALGAERSRVLYLIMLRGTKLTLIGMLVGGVAAVALGRAMSSVLYGVKATDPVTFGCVAALLAGVALMACLLPALRATKVDPMLALRYD
jgi:predicted permease